MVENEAKVFELRDTARAMMHNYLWKVQMWTQPLDLIMRKPEICFIVKVGLQVVKIGGQYIHVGRDVMENGMKKRCVLIKRLNTTVY